MATRAHFGVDPKLTSVLGETYSSTERALCELVDNAWDAEAENVWVTLPEPMTSDPIVVKDDGTGMTTIELRTIYLKIANDRLSRSKDERTANKKRLVKGRKGIGKFAGLAAAKTMQLETTARGTLTKLTIQKEALLEARGQKDLEGIDLPLETRTAPESEHGTTLTLSELDQLKQFPSAEVFKRLLVREYGREADFTVYVNGERLAVTDLGGVRQEKVFDQADVGRVKVSWTISEKPLPKSEAGFVYRIGGKVVGRATFCGIDELEDIPEKVRNRIYGEIEADGLDKHVTADWGQLVENSIPLRAIETEVRNSASQHVREVCKSEVSMAKARLAKEYKARIETLPEYRREYANEAVERVIAKYFPEGDEKVKLLVGLVLDALEKDEYYRVCENIANAAGSDVATIAECLEEFGLVDIAVMRRQAKRRLDFLTSLEALVTNMESLEKPIHKALEKNLWVLGAQYSIISTNQTLKTVIENFCKKRYTGSRADKRPDLFLGQGVNGPRLLIEFKRPSETVDRMVEAQAKEYRDELTPANGGMNVLILAGKVDTAVATLFTTPDIQARGYLAVISDARTQLEWMLKELSHG